MISALVLATVLLASPTPAPVHAPAIAAAPSFEIPAATPTPDPLSYDDNSVHFRAPDGWTRVDLAKGNGDAGAPAGPAAVFVYRPGQIDQRTIVLDIQPFDGTLDGFERSKETDLRNGADGTFIDRHTKTELTNGMPAYFLQVSQPNAEVGHQVRRYDYVVYDMQRSIDLAYVGRYGDFTPEDVRKAFASLTVVVYPRGRP